MQSVLYFKQKKFHRRRRKGQIENIIREKHPNLVIYIFISTFLHYLSYPLNFFLTFSSKAEFNKFSHTNNHLRKLRRILDERTFTHSMIFNIIRTWYKHKLSCSTELIYFFNDISRDNIKMDPYIHNYLLYFAQSYEKISWSNQEHVSNNLDPNPFKPEFIFNHSMN